MAKSTHYVDNLELLDELKAFREAKAARPGATNGECMSPKLTAMLMRIVDHLTMHERWGGYTKDYIEEMKSDAYLRLVQVVHKFDPAKSDKAFGYFTTIIWRTFKGRADTENQLHEFIQDELVKNDPDWQVSFYRQAQHDIDKYGSQENESGD